MQQIIHNCDRAVFFTIRAHYGNGVFSPHCEVNEQKAERLVFHLS
jgi:hypothetical protein